MTVAFDDRPVLNLIEVQSFGVQSNTVRMRWCAHYHEQIFGVGAPSRCASGCIESCGDLTLVPLCVAGCCCGGRAYYSTVTDLAKFLG